MNDQTSPTADGQGPGSAPSGNPFQEPQSAHGLPGVPDLAPAGQERSRLAPLLPDLLAAAVLLVTGTLLGVLGALAWYRFAPTVWLTLPANAVSQVTAGVDQSALLAAPEGKGIASVDGYYFMITGAVGLVLGGLGFYLARRGFLAGRDRTGGREGAALGAWVGVLLGGLAASTLTAALGRWISMPDPLTVLHTIAAGHNFHAPVALHAQGLYLAAPLLGMVLFFALTTAFTRPAPPPWETPYGQRGYFTAGNPYGFPAGSAPGQLGQPGHPEQNGGPGPGPGQNGGPGSAPGANPATPQADTSRS
jgi:hypothetical protein